MNKNQSNTLGEVLGKEAVGALVKFSEASLTDAQRKAIKRAAWEYKLKAMLGTPGLVARVGKDTRVCSECDLIRAFLSQPGKVWSDESPISAIEGRLLPSSMPEGYGALVSQQHSYSHLQDVA